MRSRYLRDFTASNLGLPRNPALPFYEEDAPDQFGYTANPDGLKFLDLGVGGFPRGCRSPRRATYAARAPGSLVKISYFTSLRRTSSIAITVDFIEELGRKDREPPCSCRARLAATMMNR